MPDHNRNRVILDLNPPRCRKSYLLYYRTINAIAEFRTTLPPPPPAACWTDERAGQRYPEDTLEIRVEATVCTLGDGEAIRKSVLGPAPDYFSPTNRRNAV
jgi:hypothetical protein